MADLGELEIPFWDTFEVYPQQRRFIASQLSRTNRLFLGGRGTGKTHALVLAAIFNAIANPGAPGAIFGRTYRDIEDTIQPYLEDHLAKWHEVNGWPLHLSHNKGMRRFRLWNGSTISLRNYERLKKVRGPTWAWACIDEIEWASVDSKRAFEDISATLRHKGGKHRFLSIATSPNGLRGATAHFLDQQLADSERYYSVRATVHDNPYVDDQFRENLRAACSPRQWKQEGLGYILKPVSSVFAEYDEARHLVDWAWIPDLPWGIGIDWGESHAYFCAVQFDPTGLALPPGSWVVAHEEKHEGVSRTAFRHAIREFVDSVPRGCEGLLAAGDRAVPKENAWLRNVFYRRFEFIGSCEPTEEQAVRHGVEMMRYMLDPIDSPPRLYFASSLPAGTHEAGRGIRGAMQNYRYKVAFDGAITNSPLHDNVNCHPIDALRYLVVKGAGNSKLHGGGILPYLTGRETPHREAA